MTQGPKSNTGLLDAQLRAALDGHDDTVLLLDEHGRIAYANRRAATVFGLDAESPAGGSIFDYSDGVTAEEWPAHWQRVLQQESLTGSFNHVTRDGTVYPLDVNDCHVVIDGKDYSFVIARDSSHLDVASRQMLLMQFSIDMIGESVFWIGPDATVQFANIAAGRKLGYSNKELTGMSVSELDPNFPLEIWPLHWEELRERGHLTFETAHRRKDGHVFPVEVSANLVKVGDHEYNCAFVRDITERKLAEGKLQQMATRDLMTGLPNQTLFNDRIEQNIIRCGRHHARMAVLFIDLDRFQEVNQAHGRQTGDRAILAVAARLQTPLRATDTIARWSSDTFAVLVDNIASAEDAGTIASKLLDTLHAPLQIGPLSLTLGASIGIAVYPDDGGDALTLCKNADIAMFRAAEIGGNTIQFFGQSPRADGTRAIEMLLDMRHAIQRNELRLRYQPVLSAGSREVVSFEAQLLWDHPQRGPLESDRFMDVAEETGFSLEIGHWLIGQVCAQFARWREAGLNPPRITLELTLRQLRDDELFEVIRTSLDLGGIAPGNLELTLPTMLLGGPREQTEQHMQKLRELGVELAVSGFGQTPTIPGMLQSLPITRVRLDCDSTCGPGDCLSPNPLVRGLVALCHAVGLEITLSGIDNEQRLFCATENGCDAIAGELLAAPMDTEAATAWLAAHRDE